MGDFILTLPAIAALRRYWPRAFIELVGRPQYAELAVRAQLINNVRSLDSARLALYFQNEAQLPQNEKEYIRSFDLIVSYLHDPDGIFLSHLKESGAQKIVAVSPLVKSEHAADHFFKAIEDAPKTWTHFIKCVHGPVLARDQLSEPDFKEWPQVLLEWPRSLKEEARRRLADEIGNRQIVVIHPGSGSAAKNWPAEKFAMLAKKIRNETSFEPLIIGGEADDNAIAVMRRLLPDFYIYENLPLLDVASILSVAGGLVGNDSGITHLAAALGIPVVALFGPTDPAVWAPRGKNVAIIKSRLLSNESLAEIEVEDIFQALIKALDDTTDGQREF